jgi:putative nucleotidyltransferase with HDIG domain
MNTSPVTPESLLDLSKLPTLPQSLVDLIEACNDSERDIYSIGSLVARDALISARILQLANSAFSGARSAFIEIEQAVIFLGTDTVRNLAVSVSVHQAFNSRCKDSEINMNQFWYHSLLTALLAKEIAEVTGYASPAEAYLGGLLHDLGKLLLSSTYPEKYGAILSELENTDQLIEFERKYLGICHTEASALLVRQWNLQETIAEAIEHHHSKQTFNGESPSLTEIITLANTICLKMPYIEDYSIFSQTSSLTSETLEECCRHASDIIEDIAGAMGITIEQVNNQPTFNADNKASTEGLARSIGSITQIFGALDNLLRANDRDRICQIVEESLHILFDIKHSFILLRTETSSSSLILTSRTNPLHSYISEVPVPQGTSASIITSCFEKPHFMYASKHIAPETISTADTTLISFFECDALVTIPLPISHEMQGVLVCGLSQEKIQFLLSNITPITLIGVQAGSRLQLEEVKKSHGQEVAQRELATISAVAKTIAHEIANPLGIIQNYVTRFEKRFPNISDIQQHTDLISKEIERISEVSSQLADITNISEKDPIKTERLDHLFKDVLTLFRTSVFAEKNIDVSIRLQPETRSLNVPSNLLRQVLAILFGNAADALVHGGRISVNGSLEATHYDPSRNMLRIDVADNGSGVAPSILEFIFNAGITTKQEGHLGLGLSIARKLLVDKGGALQFEQPATGGACFILYLPLKK